MNDQHTTKEIVSSDTKTVSKNNIRDQEENLKQIVQELLKKAKQKGATQAEVSASISDGFSTTVRMGEVDTVEYNRDKGIGITVYFGHRKGSASSSDTRKEALETTLQAACDIAQYTTEDPFSGLAEKELMAKNYPNLDLYHPWDLTPEQGIALAKQCEDKARSLDKRIVNSEGASVASHQGIAVYGNTNEFLGVVPSSRHSLSCALVAQEAQSMERDYGYTVARDPSELESFSSVAEEAATRTVRRLQAQRLSTRKAPVIFAADIARGFLSHFLSAIQGGNLYRKSSFLLDHLGKEIFPKHISLTENPHLLKGIYSAPFDDDGVATVKHDIVKNGILDSYILGSYSARKLGLKTTGNAGGVHNIEISTSSLDLPALLKLMGTGLLVTEVMGQGVNIVTGDYSRGAFGFWVENGEIQYPVTEITIAANLKDCYANLIQIANDIDLRGNIRTGSVLIEEMMIAGE